MPEERIYFKCSHCSKKLDAAFSNAGKKGKCPGCGELLEVPKKDGTKKEPSKADPMEEPVVAEITSSIKRGQQASISFYDDEPIFLGKVSYYEAWIALAGDNYPRLTVVAMKSRQPSGEYRYIIAWVGPYQEHENQRYCFPSDEEFKKHMSPDVLKKIKGKGLSVSNYAMPGCSLTSTERFDNIVKNIGLGKYALVKVLALDGKPPKSTAKTALPAPSDHGKPQKIVEVQQVRKCSRCGYVETCGVSIKVDLAKSGGTDGESPPGAAIECCKCGRESTEMLWRSPDGKFFKKAVKASVAPSATHQQQTSDNRLRSLVQELVEIGKKKEGDGGSGFGVTRKGTTGRNERAIEIGTELDKMGGEEMMHQAHRQVQDQLGSLAARELEAVWGEIGTWQA